MKTRVRSADLDFDDRLYGARSGSGTASAPVCLVRMRSTAARGRGFVILLLSLLAIAMLAAVICSVAGTRKMTSEGASAVGMKTDPTPATVDGRARERVSRRPAPPTRALPPPGTSTDIAAGTDVPAESRSIAVLVIASGTETPIDSAAVEGLWGAKGESDAEGHVMLTGYSTGFPQVWATSPGYVPSGRITAIERPGGRLTATIKLTVGVGLRGRVVDAISGRPVEGATLDPRTGHRASALFGPLLQTTTSLADGSFELPCVPPWGTVYVIVTSESHASAVVSVQNAARRTEPLVAELVRAATLIGHVETPTGDAAVGVQVRVVLSDNPSVIDAARGNLISAGGTARWLVGLTASDGSFRVPNLLLDRRYVAFAATDVSGPGPLTSVLVPTALPADVVLQLPETGRLRVVVVGPNGEPVPRAGVSLDSQGSFRRWLERDESGHPVHPAVPPGKYGLKINANGYLPAVARAEIRAREEAVIDVTLAAGLAMTGSVVDIAGNAIPGATVTAHGGEFDQVANTDERGAYRVSGLLPESIRITAASEGFVSARARASSPSEDVRLTLTRKATIRLRVRLPDGIAAANGSILREWYDGAGEPDPAEATRSGWSRNQATLNFRDGLASIEWSAPPGALRLIVVTDGFAPEMRHVRASHGETIDLGEVTLGPGLSLRGRVRDDAGRAVSNARIDALQRLSGSQGRTLTNADGRFVIGSLGPGPVEVTVRAARHGHWKRVLMADEISASLDVMIPRLRRVTVRVLDANGDGDDKSEILCIVLNNGVEGSHYGMTPRRDGTGIHLEDLHPAVYRLRLLSEDLTEDFLRQIANSPFVDVDATGDDPPLVILRPR